MYNIKILKSVLIASLLFSTFGTFAQRVNFSGNWSFLKNQSDLSEYPSYVFPPQLQVRMTTNSIFIDAVVNKVASLSLAKYPLNGSETQKSFWET